MIKQFKVSMEFDVTSTDFADVVVDAKNEEEARQIALTRYLEEKLSDLEFYSDGDIESEINADTTWACEEIDSKMTSLRKQGMNYIYPKNKGKKNE